MYVIHGTGDDVFSYDDVARDVEAMAQSGADVTLNTVEGASHAALWSYREALSVAMPWITQRL